LEDLIWSREELFVMRLKQIRRHNRKKQEEFDFYKEGKAASAAFPLPDFTNLPISRGDVACEI
jgi:hypothetical protein